MRTIIILLSVIFMGNIYSQTSHNYYESFDVNNETGWAFTAADAEISIQEGKLNLTSTSDDIVYILPPIPATKDDFSFKLTGAGSEELYGGGFGRMGFKSFIGIYIEDSLYIIYSEDIKSYVNPEFIWLTSYPIPPNLNSLQLDVSRSGNNIIIQALANDNTFYNGEILNADPGLFYGQLLIHLIKDESPIVFSLDEVDIHYNPFTGGNNYLEDFNDETAPWMRFGDNEIIVESILMENGKLNFNHTGTDITSLLVHSPTGAVNNFSIEIEGGSGVSHNASFSISRFFDYKNYVTMFYEDDEIYLGYALNSIEPVIINSAQHTFTNDANIKFSVEGDVPQLTLKVWVDNQLIVSGTINNAVERLATGHLAVGFDRGNIFDAYMNSVNINFNPYITDVTDEIIIQQDQFELYQNYPNPFNPATKIKYKIAEQSFVNLKVYNLLGKEIATLVNEEKQPGIYEVEFNTSASSGTNTTIENLSSGIYFCKLTAGKYSDVKKIVLLK